MAIGLIGIEVFVVTFVLTMTLTNIILPLLKKKRAGQYILEIGPAWHKSKEGTPTMGGIAPLLSVICASSVFLLYLNLSDKNINTAPIVLTMFFAVGNSLVGVFDDITKLKNKRNDGFTPWQKLILQTTFATAYAILLVRYGVVDTRISIPFTEVTLSLGFIWYPLAVIFLVWFVNCANLTDGIDGLASSVGCMVALGFVFLALHLSSSALLLCSACLVGGTLGFFVFNRHPAKIFMGDTGSLFFGALAVGCAFVSGSPLIMLPLGIVYTIEGASVVLQVVFFKFTRGKRLFKMAPFHHHLEKKGWTEWRIVLFFASLTLVAALGVYIGVK